MGKSTSNGKTIYVRKGESKDDAFKRYGEKDKKELTLDEKIQKNSDELRKVGDELYRLPLDADEKTFQRINNKLNELQRQQEELTKEKKKEERQSKKAKQAEKSAKVKQGDKKVIQQQIDKLKSENASLLEQDYRGRKNWGKQLDARVKKAKSNNTKIQKLEKELQKLKQ